MIGKSGGVARYDMIRQRLDLFGPSECHEDCEREKTIRTQSFEVEHDSIRVEYIRFSLCIHLKSEISASSLRINVKVGCEVTKGLRP